MTAFSFVAVNFKLTSAVNYAMLYPQTECHIDITPGKEARHVK